MLCANRAILMLLSRFFTIRQVRYLEVFHSLVVHLSGMVVVSALLVLVLVLMGESTPAGGFLKMATLYSFFLVKKMLPTSTLLLRSQTWGAVALMAVSTTTLITVSKVPGTCR